MIYFPHIPKAGGTTLKKMFYQAFGKENCVKVWDGNTADVTPENFESYDFSNQSGDVVLGHLPVSIFFRNNYCLDKFQADEVTIITSVREPIERIISQYNYIFFNKEHPKNAKIKKIGFEEYLLSIGANFQTNFLSYENYSKFIKVIPLESAVLEFRKVILDYSGINVEIPKIANKTTNFSGGAQLLTKSMLTSSFLESLESKHSEDYMLFNSFNY
jgi:hypothetical protein